MLDEMRIDRFVLCVYMCICYAAILNHTVNVTLNIQRDVYLFYIILVGSKSAIFLRQIITNSQHFSFDNFAALKYTQMHNDRNMRED